jgi:hypothetical protein
VRALIKRKIKNAHVWGDHDDVSPGADNGLRVEGPNTTPPFIVDGEESLDVLEMGFGGIHFSKRRDL